MWTTETRSHAERLLIDGRAVSQVARITGVPRSTIKRWSAQRDQPRKMFSVPSGWRPEDPGSYAYALGIYLGDGHVVWGKNSGTVGIALDAAYPNLLRALRPPVIRWTQSNPRNISISHRDSVALLDSFVGPKE